MIFFGQWGKGKICLLTRSLSCLVVAVAFACLARLGAKVLLMVWGGEGRRAGRVANMVVVDRSAAKKKTRKATDSRALAVVTYLAPPHVLSYRRLQAAAQQW